MIPVVAAMVVILLVAAVVIRYALKQRPRKPKDPDWPYGQPEYPARLLNDPYRERKSQKERKSPSDRDKRISNAIYALCLLVGILLFAGVLAYFLEPYVVKVRKHAVVSILVVLVILGLLTRKRVRNNLAKFGSGLKAVVKWLRGR